MGHDIYIVAITARHYSFSLMLCERYWLVVQQSMRNIRRFFSKRARCTFTKTKKNALFCTDKMVGPARTTFCEYDTRSKYHKYALWLKPTWPSIVSMKEKNLHLEDIYCAFPFRDELAQNKV